MEAFGWGRLAHCYPSDRQRAAGKKAAGRGVWVILQKIVKQRG